MTAAARMLLFLQLLLLFVVADAASTVETVAESRLSSARDDMHAPPMQQQQQQQQRRNQQVVDDNEDEDEFFYIPTVRYWPWLELSERNQSAARALGYTEELWNRPGTAHVEMYSWWELNGTQTDAATVLGFDEPSWDCAMVHYFYGYNWNDLDYFELSGYYERMGWNQSSFEGSLDYPSTFTKIWDELTSDEMEAASSVCWFREIWNGLSLTEWDDPSVPPLPRLRITGDIFYEDGSTDLDFPSWRYNAWSDLSLKQTFAAKALGYTESTWNRPGTNILEQFLFHELNDAQQAAATTLGFDEEIWDCSQNHFQSRSSWDSLGSIAPLYEELGWNRASFEGSVDPPPRKPWSELTSDQQAAATEICWFSELWDGLDITEYQWDTVNEKGDEDTYYDSNPLARIAEAEG